MRIALLSFLVALVMFACGDGNVVIQVDPAVQLQEDSIAIVQYLSENGYEDYEYTSTGIWYLILDPGTGIPIDESDIVTFDFNTRLLNDTIFDTSIQEVGDSIRAHFLVDSVGLADKSIHEAFLNSFPENRDYSSLIVTYSTNGWTIPSGFPYRTNSQNFGDGFKNGLSASLQNLNVGGRALVFIPSGQGFATQRQSIIPANSSLILEFFPTDVIKQ